MLCTEEVLERAAKDGSMNSDDWQRIFDTVMLRLDHIVYNDFPIPSVPLSPLPPVPQFILESHSEMRPARQRSRSRQGSPRSQSIDKENAPPSSPPTPPVESAASSPPITPARTVRPPDGTLPPALLASLTFIKRSLATGFSANAPFTIQRLAEMILRPRQYYRYLHAYLNSLERVVSVVSGENLFPLPTIGNHSGGATLTNGNGTSNLCSDESLGGALLSPIPWLHKDNDDSERSPKRRRVSLLSVDNMNGDPATSAQLVEHALREEGGVTQGELLRQEQVASDPPPPVASASSVNHSAGVAAPVSEAGYPHGRDGIETEETDEQPHARGPDAIGWADTGPQEHDFGVGQVLDMEAAVGRPGQGGPGREPIANVADDTDGAGTPEEVQESTAVEENNGDVIITDADGITEEEKRNGGFDADQTGPDAIDTTMR